MCNILKNEAKKDREFVVKDVRCIPAQVKVVKCTVQHIAIDISFNQIAGLCSLCFLEQVDRCIGKDHLFKRSIILIKAWCYYESRILGAYHGLISTYALETLVLCIINLFHSSLHGPLAVLYKFLDYYSTFDWDKYCVSLNGPVTIKFLPESMVVTLENDGNDLLLTKEFLQSHIEDFSVLIRALETNEQTFALKHLNVIDPLKDGNNLGRSVSKGNFLRIRSALSYGARKLREILKQPGKNMDEGLKKFFVNTLNRNGRGQRHDVRTSALGSGGGCSEVSDLTGNYDSHLIGLRYGQSYHNYILPVPFQPTPPMSSSLVQNRSAYMQINQNVFSVRNTNDFVMRSFCHPNASGLFNASLGVEEASTFRGMGRHIPVVSVEEKLNSKKNAAYIPDTSGEKKPSSRGTGTFIPYICVEERWMMRGTFADIHDVNARQKLKLQGVGTSGSDVSVEEKLKFQGIGTDIFDMEVEENVDLGGIETCILDMSLDEKAKSQGATCVEEQAKHSLEMGNSPQAGHSYEQMDIMGRERNPESKTRGVLLKSPRSKEQVQVLSESNKDGNSSCFHLSLEEFPLLPSSKKAIPPSDNNQPFQPIAESLPNLNCSPHKMSVNHVSFRRSAAPSGSSSSVPRKQQGFGVSTNMDSELGILARSTEGQLSEGHEEKVLVPPYKLDDEKDFPPLSR